jgi:hypothetical protein
MIVTFFAYHILYEYGGSKHPRVKLRCFFFNYY